MDTIVLVRHVPTTQTNRTRFVSSLYHKARTFRDPQYHRACNKLATEASRITARLRQWYHAPNFFDNVTNLQAIARFAVTYQEELMMAKRTSPQRNFERAEWKGFLERPFTDDELARADEWTLDDVGIVEGIIALEAQGYSLKVSYSKTLGASTATMIAGNEYPKFSGYALSARGADGRDALKLLFYKHYHLLEEDWTPLLGITPKAKRG